MIYGDLFLFVCYVDVMLYNPLLQLFSVNMRHLKKKDALDNIMYIESRYLQCSTG